jgi:signal transduction histidine kinase
LLILMLIMSATAHLVAIRPAALVGFPVMIIGATTLILLLLYLVAPDVEPDGQDPVARAVENAFVTAVAADPQTGRILAANEKAVNLLGPRRLAIGSRFRDLFTERSSSACERLLNLTADAGEQTVDSCTVRTQSGRPLSVELTGRFHEVDRSSFVVIAFASDEIGEAVAQFARVQERLMSNISHELRTPLNVVMGFSELLTTGTLGKLADNQLDAAEECHEGGERMLRLINDILDVGRSRSYYLNGEVKPLAPQEMIRRVSDLLSGQARREDIALSVDVQDDMPVLETEERAFKQLVYHLMLNGMDRSEAGDTVTVNARCENEHLTLSVADRGSAVTAEITPRPVPEMSEEDAADTLAPPVLGIPLCATLAERLGGTLTVDAEAEEVRFVLKMPVFRS